jgi:ABC-type phosphate/phosphonate transport system substrate-binding protein
MFKDVPKSMADAAATPFKDMIQKMAGVNGVIELVPDYKELARRLKDGQIDIAVFHGFEYAWVKDTPNMVPLVVTAPNCGKVQACLIVHADSKVKEPKDLKGACIAVPMGSKAHCEMFLERTRDKLTAGDCCPTKCTDMTPQDVLCAVARKDNEAALVDISSWLALEKNLPGAYKKLRVLTTSVELPSAVVVYRKGALDKATVERVRTGLLECVKTPLGQVFSIFWQLKGFKDIDTTYNKLVADALKAYPPPDDKTPQAPAPKGPK